MSRFRQAFAKLHRADPHAPTIVVKLNSKSGPARATQSGVTVDTSVKAVPAPSLPKTVSRVHVPRNINSNTIRGYTFDPNHKGGKEVLHRV
jgi:hypothetical protein